MSENSADEDNDQQQTDVLFQLEDRINQLEKLEDRIQDLEVFKKDFPDVMMEEKLTNLISKRINLSMKVYLPKMAGVLDDIDKL
jgi:hypothetical protein